MLCSDHLRAAAIAAVVLKKDQDFRFGYHTMRHSLASFLVGRGENPTVVQRLLRHSNVATTLGLYSHARCGLFNGMVRRSSSKDVGI